MEEGEALGETIEESIDSGEGLSDTAADMVEIQTESISRRLGLVGYKSVAIASESLKRRSNMDRARIALEGVGDMMNNAWETIKKWFKKLWTSIKNFYKSIFDANYKLIKRAEALKAKKFSSKDEDTDDIEDSSIYVGFAIDGSFKTQNVIDILKNHGLIVEAVRGLTEKAAETVKNIREKPQHYAETLKASLNTAFVDAADKATLSKYDGHTGEEGDGKISGSLIDGMKMGYYQVLETDYGSKGDKSGKIPVMKFFHSTDPDADDDRDDVTVETASIENCRKICSSVIELAKAMEALAKNQKKIESIEKALDSEFDKFNKIKGADRVTNDKYNKDSGGTPVSNEQSIVPVVKSFGSLVASSNTASLKYGYKAGVKALNYVAKSQSKFKKV
jgi:hypothetical protein